MKINTHSHTHSTEWREKIAYQTMKRFKFSSQWRRWFNFWQTGSGWFSKTQCTRTATEGIYLDKKHNWTSNACINEHYHHRVIDRNECGVMAAVVVVASVAMEMVVIVVTATYSIWQTKQKKNRNECPLAGCRYCRCRRWSETTNEIKQHTKLLLHIN